VVAVWPGLFLDTMVDDVIGRMRSSAEPAMPGLRGAAGLVARLGAREVLVPLALVAGGVVSWRRRSWVPLALVVGSYLLVAGVASFTKAGLARPQPLPLPGVPGRAFPSGHAAQAVVVFGALALLAGGGRRVLLLVAGVVGAVCLALLWRQAHWLTDMVGGVALGAACLTTVDALLRRERSPVVSLP
jgi:membrane-associated phospholipid phosphatase